MNKFLLGLTVLSVASLSSIQAVSIVDQLTPMKVTPGSTAKMQKMPYKASRHSTWKLPAQFGQIKSLRADTMGTRYETIKVSPEIALNEITFWARQLSEHALFLHLGIEDAALKAQGMELHKKFEAFRKNISESTMNQVLPLAKELRDYKITILKTLNAGKWIGWIFPLFARHIILELDYFVDKLNGIPYSDQDEIAFWNIINGEHAGFAAHLLDPSERALFEQADSLNQKFEKIVNSEDEMMLQISLKTAKELDQYAQTAEKLQKANNLKSVIHPVLLAHVIREGQRSIETLDQLSDKTGAIYPKEMEEQLGEIAAD